MALSDRANYTSQGGFELSELPRAVNHKWDRRESEMMKKTTMGTQGGRRLHSSETPSVSNCSSKCPHDIRKLVLEHFWKQELSLSEIVSPEPTVSPEEVPGKQTSHQIFNTQNCISCPPPPLSAFLPLFLPLLLLYVQWFWHQRRTWLQQSKAWRAEKEERGRAARRRQRAYHVFATSHQPWLHTALVILMGLTQRTVFLHSCFSWSYTAVPKVQKCSACMF